MPPKRIYGTLRSDGPADVLRSIRALAKGQTVDAVNFVKTFSIKVDEISLGNSFLDTQSTVQCNLAKEEKEEEDDR